MKTFDILNYSNFNKTGLHFNLPQLKPNIPYSLNIKYGLLTGILMSTFSLVVKQPDSLQLMLIPLYTLPLLAFGIWVSIKEYGIKSGQARIDYFAGLGNAFFTGIIAVKLFSAFALWHLFSSGFCDPYLSFVTII